MVRRQRVITLKDLPNQRLGLHAPTRTMAPKRAGMLVSRIIRFQPLRGRHSAVLPLASSLYPFRVYHHIKFPIITLANPPHSARLLCWLQRPRGAGCERHRRTVLDPWPRPAPHRYVLLLPHHSLNPHIHPTSPHVAPSPHNFNSPHTLPLLAYS